MRGYCLNSECQASQRGKSVQPVDPGDPRCPYCGSELDLQGGKGSSPLPWILGVAGLAMVGLVVFLIASQGRAQAGVGQGAKEVKPPEGGGGQASNSGGRGVEAKPVGGAEPPSLRNRRVYQVRLSLPDGKETRRDSSRQIGFWTPSLETPKNIQDGSGRTGQPREWQVIGNNDVRAATFGEILAGVRKPGGVDWKKDKGVFGWRRYQAYGFGSTARKDGWWWILTVKDTFDLTDFAKLYAEFWYDGTSPHPATQSRYSFPDPKEPGKVKQEDLFIEEYYP